MASHWHRLNTMLLILLVLAVLSVVAMLATGVRGGPLDPPGAPASSMKTLDQIPGSWDRRLVSTNGAPSNSLFPPPGCDSDRFKCVLSYQQCGTLCFSIWPAVLDEETGLVWERSPGTSVAGAWAFASQSCGANTTGNRYGWRLPTREELLSLLDPTNAQQLPAGHPFSGVSAGNSFWTQSRFVDTSQDYFYITINGAIGGDNAAASHRAWCVRGAQAADKG